MESDHALAINRMVDPSYKFTKLPDSLRHGGK